MGARHNLSGDQFFHVTTASAIPSIKEHGLNNEQSREELWSNTDDWDSGAYLWDSHERAQQYASDLTEMGHEPRVLSVRGEGLTLSPDTTGATEVKGGWHTPHVPPKNIDFGEKG